MTLGPLTITPSTLEFSLPYARVSYEKIVYSRKFIWLIVVSLCILSIIAWAFYFKADLTLAYNDARSHLNIARRVIDNLQPGLAQLGSVWLPLYHVLELPLVANNYLWRSGIAGSLISMIAYVAGGLYVLLIAKELSFDKKASLLVVLVYALNPNLMFMQTTPMTESLLIFLSTASVYYILRWTKQFKIMDLIASAFFTFLATLTRYDGWFLLAFIFGTVALVAYKKKGYKYAESSVFLYGSLAGLGVLLWFGWNYLIFGDPLYFATGPFSAKSQQDVLEIEGRLFSKGNLLYSTYLYTLTVIHNSGVWVSLLSVIGFLYMAVNKRINWTIKLAVSLLLVPIIFNVLSLVAGHSVIHLPTLPPYTWFNDRYGLMVLPALAILIGFLANRRTLASVLIGLIISIQVLFSYATNSIITIEDGVRGASGQYLDDASAWLKENVDEGLILVAASSNDALLFKSGLPLKQFITEGARKQWNESIVDPTTNARWVIMHKGDLVHTNMVQNPIFLKNYSLVYKDSFSYIYVLSPAGDGVTESQLP